MTFSYLVHVAVLQRGGEVGPALAGLDIECELDALETSETKHFQGPGRAG